MSIKAMSKVWGLDLKPIPKLILLALADNANEDGICWPGLAYIEHKTGLVHSTTVKYISELEAAGLLKKHARYSSDGLRASNLYQLYLEDTKFEVRTTLSAPHELGVVRETNLSSTSREQKPSINHNKEPIRQVDKSTRSVSVSQDVEEVFKHWQDTMGHPKAKLDKRRIKVINEALKTYSLDDLKQAIDGCKQSQFHMGANKNKTIHDGISVIFRDSEQIEKFIALASASTQIQTMPMALNY